MKEQRVMDVKSKTTSDLNGCGNLGLVGGIPNGSLKCYLKIML